MGKPLLHEGTARGKNTVMAKLIFALILVLHTSILAGASYTYKKFENYRLRIPSTKANKDWAIGDLRVPDGNVESCKKQCDQDDRCKLFHCDKDLSGWYRFKMDGKDDNITTECLDIF